MKAGEYIRKHPNFQRDFPWSLYWLLSERDKHRLQTVWKHLNIGGWVWPSVYVIGALFFTNFTSNPLMWISFNQPIVFLGLHFGSFYTYDHFWDLLLIAGLTFALAGYFTRNGYKLMAVGAIATWGSWLMWTGHEGMWWVVDVILNPSYWKYLFGYGSLLTFATVFIFYQFGYVPWRFLGWMAIYYAVWVAFGFHVTVNYPGPTQYFNDPVIFSQEICSWTWAAWGFWHFERKNLLDWYRASIAKMHGSEILPSSKTLSSNAPSQAPMSHNVLRRMQALGLSFRRRAASQSSMVVGIAIDLILWAAVGLLALSLLST